MTPPSASTAKPKGPVTMLLNICPPVLSIRALKVPSPPSATGTSAISVVESHISTPRAIARAAANADRLPLKACGATTTFSLLEFVSNKTYSLWIPMEEIWPLPMN